MRVLAVLLLASALAGTAAAKTIDITISQVARVADGNLVVEAKIGNSGDESALTVTPILRFGDKEVRGKGTPRLDPDASFEETLSLPVGALGEGRWPYSLAVDYADLNQYALQALQTQVLVVGSPRAPKVVVAAMQGDLSGTATLEITVKNLTPEPRTARIDVLVPEGIEVTDGLRELSLDGWQDATLEVPVSNRTALLGSRYPVFVTAEYDDGTTHQAMVAQGSLTIVGVGSFVERWGSWLSIAGVTLVSAWLAYVVTRMLPRRPATARPR